MNRIVKTLTRLLTLSLLTILFSSTITFRTFAESGSTITTKSGDITITSESSSYSPSDSPSLKFQKEYSSGLKGMFQRSRQVLGVSTDTSLNLEVKDSKGNIVDSKQIPPTDSATITIDKSSLPHPGHYTTTITDPTTGSTISQDFSWGVLAINTNKSIYLKGETANLALAVLDEKGAMVCDAGITLRITDPTGSTSTLSTENGSISVQEACKYREYTLEPDYKATYQTKGAGIYEMHLTATTSNGTYSISDSFEVRDSVPFNVERISATRLYPLNEYPVLLKVTANQDFNGIIEEKLSSDLLAYYIDSAELSSRFSLDADLETGLIKTLPGKDNGEVKTLRWQVDWKEGETYHIAYYFDPPNISPEFYTLGPLTIGNFQETRLWQLANDDTTVKTWTFTTDAEGLADQSGSNFITFAHDAGDSAVKFTGGKKNTTETEQAYNASTGETWETWGVTSGSTVTAVQVTGWDEKLVSQTVLNSHTITARIINSSGTTVHSAGDLLAAVSLDTDVDTGYESKSAGTSRAVDASYQASTTDVRLWLEYSANHGNDNGATVDQRFDNIDVTITYTPPATGDAITGKVYTDDTESTPISSVDACVAINASHNAADCATTDGTGTFSISSTSSQTNSGDQLTFFLDGGTYFGNTITVADGADIVAGDNLRIYENHVLVRYEQGTSIGIAAMDAYDNDQNATDILFDAEDAATDTLVIEDGNEFYIPSGVTFTPAGNLDDGAGGGIDDIEIVGTYTSASGESILVSGSWLNSGTFTASTSTVKFDATTGTETINSTGASTATFNNLTLGVTSGSATWNLGSALDVNGNLTIDYGTLAMNGSNNINIAGNLSIGGSGNYTSSTGTFTFDGSGTSTWTNASTLDNLGTVSINGSTKTISLASSALATSVNVASGQTLGLASSGYTLEITGSGTAGSRPFIVTGTLNEGTSSTVKFSGTSATEIEPETYYNLTLAPAASPTYTLGTTTSQTFNVSGDLIIGDNTNGVTVSAETYDPTLNVDNNFTINTAAIFQASSTGTFTIGNDYTNSGTFTANSGTVTFDAQDSGNTIAGTLTSTSAFNGITFDDSGTSGAWTFSNNMEANGAFTITGGSVTGPSSGTMNLGGNFDNDDTFVHNSSSLTFDNSAGGTVTIDADGTGSDSLNTVTFDDSAGGTTFQLTAAMTTAGNLTITGGTLAFNDQTLTVGGNYANNDTVTLGGTSDTLLMNNSAGGTVTLDATGTGTSSLYNVTFDDSAGNTTFQLTSALDANNDLTITGGTLDSNTQNINVGGSWSNSDIFTSSSGTVTFDSTDAGETIAGNLTGSSAFNVLVFNDGGNSGAWTFSNNTEIGSNFTITGGSVTAPSSGTLTITGNFDNDDTFVHNNSTITMNNSGAGTVTIDADGTGSEALYNLTLNDGAGGTTFQLTTLLDIDNDLTITGGTLDANGQTLSVGGSWSNSDIFTANSNTTTFDSTDAGETIAGTLTGSSAFHHITFNDGGNSGAWTFSNNTEATGNFTITGGSVTGPSSGTLTITGNFDNDDTFIHNVSTITLNASSGTISIDADGTGADALAGLVLDDQAGTTTFQLTSNIDINGTFNITDGTFSMNGANNIYTAGSVTIANGANYTKGTGTWYFDGAATPISLTDNNATKQNLGTVVVDGTAKTVSLQTEVLMDSLQVGGDDVLAMGTNNVTVGATGSTNSGSLNIAGSTTHTSGTLTIISSASGTATFQGAGTLTAANLTIGNGSTSFTVDNETNDLAIDLSGNFTVTSNAIFQSSSTANFEVAGDWSNSGTFTANSSSITLNATTGTPTITSGSSAFNALELNDNGNNITWTLQDTLDTNSNLTITGGTLDTGTNYQINVGGIFTNNDTFTANSGTVVMDGASGSIAGTSNTAFHSLNIDGANITLTSSDPTVSNTLTISANDTLTINTNRSLTVTNSGSISLDSTGTITGAGTLIFRPSSGFPTVGTVTSIVEYDSNGGNQTIAARTYGDNLILYNNSASARSYTLGTGSSQTINISGNLTLTASSGTIALNASTHNPTVNVTGNISYTAGGSAESITSGSGTWTVSGNVDFTNGTFTASTGNTLIMDGASKSITSNSQSLYNFNSSGTISNSDAMTVNNNFTVSGGTFSVGANIDTNGAFSLSSGTFNHGSGANLDVNIAGDFTITNGTTWTENTDATSQVIFDGDLNYADNTAGTKQSIGNVQIGTSPETTNLTTDFSATSLTVNAADYFNTCGYEVDIGTGGINVSGTLDTSATGSGVSPCNLGDEGDETIINTAEDFNLNSGATFVQDQSTVIFDAGSGTNTLITDGSFSLYNLEIATSATTEVQDPLDIDNNLTLTSGTLDAVSAENNQINVGGNWNNNGGTFVEQQGKVVLDGTSSTSLDSNCSDVSTCTNENFYDLEINKTSGTGANDNVTLTNTGIRVSNTITITDGELIQGTLNTRAEGATAISIAAAGTWTNTSTGNFALGGTLSNSGVITLQGTSSSCGEADAITISSTAAVQRSWNGTGTFNINDVTVSYMGGSAAINAYSSTDNGNNDTNWNFAECPINFSGYVYNYGTTNALTECDTDSGTYELRLRVAGTTQSASCDDATGAFTFTSIPGPTAGDGLIAWIDDAVVAGTDGALVVRYDGTGASDNNIFYDDAVTVMSDDTTAADILDFNFYDNADDPDIPYTATDSTPDTLVVNSGYALVVKLKSGVANGSTVFDPGGTVTTNATGGDLHVDDNAVVYLDTATNTIGRDVIVDGGATLYVETNTNVNGGDITTTGTSATVSYSTGTPTLTISGTGSIGGGTTPTLNFYNLSTSGSGTTSLSSSATINNNGTVGSGTTFNINADLSVAGNLTNTTTGVIGNSSGTPTTTFTGSATIGGGSGNITFYNLTTSGTGTSSFSGSGTNNVSGNVTVGTGTTINLNSSLTIAGNLTNTTTGVISTSAGTPDISVQGSSIGGGSGNLTFYDLSIAGNTTLSNSGTNTINNNLAVESGTFTQSSPITVTGDASVAAGATHNVNANLTINGGAFTTASTGTISTTAGTPTINITGTGNLGGGSGNITIYNLTVDGVSTITTASDFTITNVLTIGDGTNAATLQVNTNDSAVTTRHLTINANGQYSASSNTSYPLTISDDFTNSGTFTANSGKVIFNNASNTSTLSYSSDTTFADLDVSTAGKAMQFDDTYTTYVTTALTLQGTNCSTGRVFLDSETDNDTWAIDATGATVDIDYVDVEDSVAVTTALTAENSTAENNNNTNWTINEGACGAKETRMFNNVRMFSGSRIR